jgi:hypothetical protein
MIVCVASFSSCLNGNVYFRVVREVEVLSSRMCHLILTEDGSELQRKGEEFARDKGMEERG